MVIAPYLPTPGAFHRLSQTPPSQDSHHLATIFRCAPDVVDRSRFFGREATGVFNDLVGQRLPLQRRFSPGRAQRYWTNCSERNPRMLT